MRALIPFLTIYEWNRNLFSDMVLPAGVNKKTVVDEIVLECAELEPLYPDPVFLREAIGIWSRTEQRDWEKVLEAAAAEFNPIENYDRRETWTDTGSSQSSGESTGSVAGYNTDTLSPSNSDSSSGSSSGTSTHDGRVHGNIGVTTAPQMLKEFLEIEPQLNIYKYIAFSFKRRFCLLVY